MLTKVPTQLLVDGTLHQGDAIRHWADALVKIHARAEWTLDIASTTEDLLSPTGALHARTSGTTGAPQTIPIPAEDLVASALLTARAFGLQPGDRALLCFPCSFIAGKMMLVRAMVRGLDLHVVDPSGSVLDKITSNGVFVFTAMVPQQLQRALHDDRTRVEEQFRTILLGGGPVSSKLVNMLKDIRTHVFHSYASTETVTHVALRALNGPEASDHFTAMGDVTFSVDERGCLIIRTPHLSTASHVTNDVVELLDPTHFRWLGRADNVILSGGKKVFPEDLEARTADLIREAHYFIGIPDEYLGQAIALVIETDRPQEEVLEMVIERLRTVLSRHELPRSVITRGAFERTPSGKVIRMLPGV